MEVAFALVRLSWVHLLALAAVFTDTPGSLLELGWAAAVCPEVFGGPPDFPLVGALGCPV